MNKTLSRCIVPFGVALIAGLSLIAAVNRFKSYDRSVSVRGLCEREVKADVAYYPISFSRDGNNLVDLNKDMQSTNKSVVEFLKKNGFEDSEITLTVPTINDHRSESYRREGLADYTMNQTITLYTKKVDKVLDLQTHLSELFEMGIAISESWSGPSFEFNGLNDIKVSMIEEANKSALESAKQFAKDSHSRVGKIKDASQGYFSVEDRDVNTSHIKTVRVVTNVTYYLR